MSAASSEEIPRALKDEGAPEATNGEDQSIAAEGVAADTASNALAQLLHQIETTHAKMPRNRVDPAAVVAETREPAKILAWVRDNTRAVAYEGSLRGPAGVLMDRHGNSLDRALLVSRLLKLVGNEVRVVGGKLSPTAATVEPPQQEGPAREPRDDQKTAAKIAAAILAKTGPLAVAKPTAESTHYWAQFNDGKSWIDADPTASTIGEARTRTNVRQIAIDPETQSVARSDPDRLLHTVRMNLVVERWEAGRLLESPLGTTSFDAIPEPLSAITISFVPVDREKNTAMGRNFDSGPELYENLRGESAWAVVAGGYGLAVEMGKMFDYAGIVREIPQAFDPTGGLGGAATSSFGNFTDAFGGGPDPALEPESEKPSVLTALIADYEIAVPGKPVRRVRRFIFDSLGPEARSKTGLSHARPAWSDQQRIERGARLAGLHDTFVTFASMSGDVYAYRYAQRLIASKAAILKVSAGSTDEALVERARFGLSFRTLELFAALRDTTMDPELTVAEPQIFRREIRYTADLGASDLRVDVLGDLAWNRLASTGSSVQPMRLVTQGVLDTLQESAIVLGEQPLKPGQSAPALFEEAARQGIELVVVRRATDPILKDFPGNTRAHMLGDLEAGQILMAPRTPVSIGDLPMLGWWRIDPNSGQVVGAMDNGLMGIVQYLMPIAAGGGILVQRAAPAAQRAVLWAQTITRTRIDQRMTTTTTQFNGFIDIAEKMIADGRGDLLGI